MKKSFQPFPRLSGRLYIFPAFIPLVEIVPWLLTGIGALAGITQAAFLRRARLLQWFAVVCFVGALGVFFWGKKDIPTDIEGTRAVAFQDMSRIERLSHEAHPQTPSMPTSFAPLWTVKTQHESLSTPVVAGGFLLTGTFDGTLEARARATGALVWTLHKHEPIFANVTVAGKTAYVGEGLHTALSSVMTAFAAQTGKPLWERRFPSHLESAVTVDAARNRLWTGAGDEGLWCLDAQTGAPIWHSRIGHVDATPLLSNGVLFTPAWLDVKKDVTGLFAQNSVNGKILWQVDVQGHEMGSAQAGLADTGDIFVTTAIGQVGPQQAGDKGWAHAVTRAGKLRWSISLPGMPLPEGVVVTSGAGGDTVIYTLKTGNIVALNAADGSTAWQLQAGREFDAPTTFGNVAGVPLLAAITKEGRVMVIDAQNGRVLKNFAAAQGGYAAPVFYGDTLYVTTRTDMTAYGGVHFLLTQAGQ